jgi:transposase
MSEVERRSPRCLDIMRRTRRSSSTRSSSWCARGGPQKNVAKEFEPSAGAIRTWVKQADLDEGIRSDELTTEERGELRRLRRENKQLRMEREILKKAAAWFARESNSIPERDSSS